MTDAEVIAAIRKDHLKANIAEYQRAGCILEWDYAWVDPGGSIWGEGPYVKLPVSCSIDGADNVVIRVYAPARLRRRLASAWTRPKEVRS